MAVKNVFNGKYATVEWGGNIIANLTDWEVTATRDTVDATPMVLNCLSDIERWNTVKAGGVSWTATVAGYTLGSGSDIAAMDASDIESSPTDATVTMKFYFQCSTTTWGFIQGEAYMTGTNFGASSTAVETVGYSWVGVGKLSYHKA